MDIEIKQKLMRTTGWIFVGVGLILVYKGSPPSDVVRHTDDIIDAVFEVIEEE